VYNLSRSCNSVLRLLFSVTSLHIRISTSIFSMASVVEPSMGESSMAGICERSMIGIGEDSISHVVGSRTGDRIGGTVSGATVSHWRERSEIGSGNMTKASRYISDFSWTRRIK